MALNPYIRILKAYEKGVGVRLSPTEVRFMRFDTSIETLAANTSAGDTVSLIGFVIDKHGIREEPAHD